MTRVNLFHIVVNPEDKPLLHEVGEYNIVTSHRKEPGTLAMFVAERKDKEGSYIVFEIYENDYTYAVHRASEQYNNYLTKVGSRLIERAAFQVTPFFLKEKLASNIWVGLEYHYLKFAHVETSPEGQDSFEKSVLANMETSLAQEEGVLAMYAVRDNEDTNHWYFFEVYADEAAYQIHRDTAHFQTYLEETKDIVVDKELLDLANDTSMTQGRLK